MGDWSIHPPRPSNEQIKEIAVTEKAAHRRKKNKAARKACRANRK
jgi:hypothetical protein